jgi:hypothetical protein
MVTELFQSDILLFFKALGITESELNFINKTSFFSIYDLLKELIGQYNKLKENYNRFEWLRSLKERISDSPNEDGTYGLVNEIDIQSLNNSDKAFLQHHFDFPMFSELAYKKNKEYKANYDQKLLEFSEWLNDNGIDDLASTLLGISFEEYEKKISELDTTFNVLKTLLNTVIDKKPHKDSIMKSQLSNICEKCKKYQERMKQKKLKIAKMEKIEEIKAKGNTFHSKGLHFILNADSFYNPNDFSCFREVFDIEKNQLKNPYWLKVERNAKDEVIFYIKAGSYLCEELNDIQSFLNILRIFPRSNRIVNPKRDIKTVFKGW